MNPGPQPPSWDTLESHHLIPEQSINNLGMKDLRNFRNNRPPIIAHRVCMTDSRLKRAKNPVHNCVERNYFRFAAAILETDGNPLVSDCQIPAAKLVGHMGNCLKKN